MNKLLASLIVTLFAGAAFAQAPAAAAKVDAKAGDKKVEAKADAKPATK